MLARTMGSIDFIVEGVVSSQPATIIARAHAELLRRRLRKTLAGVMPIEIGAVCSTTLAALVLVNCRDRTDRCTRTRSRTLVRR